MTDLRWELYPLLAPGSQARLWLSAQANLGLATNTIDAYGRGLSDFFSFCASSSLSPESATRADVSAYVRDLTQRPNPRGANVRAIDSGAGLSNATLRQRLTAVRLFFDYLIEEGLRQDNPVGRGRYTPGKAYGGHRDRGLIPRYRKVPWIPSEEQWCQRWYETTTQAPKTTIGYIYSLLSVGRWLAATHPEIVSPKQWTRELAAEYVADVCRMTSCQWAHTTTNHKQLIGKPLSARTKNTRLAALRSFFRDCQEWGWIPRRLDPRRSFATPRTIRAQIGPDPRIIADDMWAKLQWAGLNLAKDDLPAIPRGEGGRYPIEMVRAMSMVWLFCGLRNNEFKRLGCGCIRYLLEDITVAGISEAVSCPFGRMVSALFLLAPTPFCRRDTSYRRCDSTAISGQQERHAFHAVHPVHLTKICNARRVA
jgi:hypothetical protein